MKKLDENQIKKEAKKIMDDFISELSKIKEIKDFKIEREDNLREEKDSFIYKEFKERWFKMIPKIRQGCVLAEKGKWK
jgi:hypothetical protein